MRPCNSDIKESNQDESNMASPEWFFSTLAQSSAAIIGFVLAFSAVIHQLERQQREKRTDKLRDELIELRYKYGNVIHNMILLLTSIEPKVTELEENGYKLEQTAVSPEEVLNKFRNNSDILHPRSASISLFLSHVMGFLQRISADSGSTRDYLLSSDKFDMMRSAIEDIDHLMFGEYDNTQELFDKLNVS
jgi:hypothetical protein